VNQLLIPLKVLCSSLVLLAQQLVGHKLVLTLHFFEVGSNLYDKKLRNRITAYNGLTNLTGKFFLVQTSGSVLADIANIVGVDTYTGTYNAGTATFRNNFGASFNVTDSKNLTWL
jgi:hypothetical protein